MAAPGFKALVFKLPFKENKFQEDPGNYRRIWCQFDFLTSDLGQADVPSGLGGSV